MLAGECKTSLCQTVTIHQGIRMTPGRLKSIFDLRRERHPQHHREQLEHLENGISLKSVGVIFFRFWEMA
jgi:hypothetical protein